jgi:hypothetical protein
LLAIPCIERPSTASSEKTASATASSKEPAKVSVTASWKERR